MMNSKKVWFITGGNKRIGAAIVKEAWDNGYNEVAAARNIDGAKETFKVVNSENQPMRLLISKGSDSRGG